MLTWLMGACSVGASPPAEDRVKADASFVLSGVSDLEEVAQLTGPGSINATDRFAVAGTDLGSMFNMEDRTYFVFGDTFGSRPEGMTGGGGGDWRSNVMAVTTDADPSDGITFDSFIADASEHATELIPSRKQTGLEITTIPTHGLAVGATMYLYYMSVNNWGRPGVWEANHSGVARSVDGGLTWEVLEGLEWSGESNFVQVSPSTIANDDGTTEIYLWGIPAGRFGGVQLMKVPEDEIEQLSSYRYFAGTDEDGSPTWSAEIDDASVVVDDTVGELSVAWNAYLHRWTMTYLSGEGGVVIREGINPWGPWGEPITVATQASHPGLYGPFMNPRYVEDDGKTIYFSLSRWDPYQVYWMKVTLVKTET
ncbi:MAG: DUF4185 domain-containing protein [Chloroflexi bacterium]|nr:DUF4185 domain-containing protein [Chloroflexota bacterium]